MTTVHELSRRDARRVAVRAQLLSAERPAGLLELVRHLGMLQDDTTDAVAPNAELVAWSRLGSEYELGAVERLLGAGSLVDVRGMLRPAEDVALFRAEMAAWPGTGDLSEWRQAQRDWVVVNDACRSDILAELGADGPLPVRALPDTTVVPWQSSGWNSGRNVRMMVDMLVCRGEVAMAGREGREPLWDLAERIYPDGPSVPVEDARHIRNERRLRALGLAREHGPECAVEPIDVGETGEPAVIKGVRGRWRVDPSYLDRPFTGRTAVLSPLDRLVYDRKRMADLFEFDYQLEMYKPAAKRRWGYWALPILHGDRLVGKVDATADRSAGVLHVDAVHEDGMWSRTMRAAVDTQIRGLARWLGLRQRR